MRDNGPVYILENNELRIQNWNFDAWGGAFGSDVPFNLDNLVPDEVGRILDMPVDYVDIAHVSQMMGVIVFLEIMHFL